jgi:hypothetical protein
MASSRRKAEADDKRGFAVDAQEHPCIHFTMAIAYGDPTLWDF